MSRARKIVRGTTKKVAARARRRAKKVAMNVKRAKKIARRATARAMKRRSYPIHHRCSLELILWRSTVSKM